MLQDGNKIYQVLALTADSHKDAQVLPLTRFVASHFEDLGDVYCHVRVAVDPKKHVKPIEVRPVAPTKAPVSISGDDKYISLAKYSYYESGTKWIKVQLDSFKDIKNLPREKISVAFKTRSFVLQVHDFNGHNFQFSVPRLQCHIKPEESSITVKSDSIQINLRKAKDDDNWWSLFKTKAVGEVESD